MQFWVTPFYCVLQCNDTIKHLVIVINYIYIKFTQYNNVLSNLAFVLNKILLMGLHMPYRICNICHDSCLVFPLSCVNLLLFPVLCYVFLVLCSLVFQVD